jgi:general secretion pathway protein J
VPRPRRVDRTLGFTLVELLVSLAVLALVALTMTAALRFVVRAVASTDDRREALEELTLGLSLVRGELQRAEPFMHKVGNRDLLLFEGSEDRIRFVNVEPPYLAGAPYTAYEFAVVENSGAWRLELRRAPLQPDEPDLAVVETVEPRTLLQLTRPLRFTYWGREQPRDPPTWHEGWRQGQFMPDAVRLAEGENPGWPDLVVPLRVTTPWYCVVAGGAGGVVAGGAGGNDQNSARAGCPQEDGTGNGNRVSQDAAGEGRLGGERSGVGTFGREEGTQ